MNELSGVGKGPSGVDQENPAASFAPLDTAILNSKALIRVMIVDGHDAVRRALCIRLNVPAHFDVVGDAPTLEKAADLVRAVRPDVIVLGLHRSSEEEMNETVRSVSSLANRVAVVIVLAPYADALERERLLNAGAKRYLLKHINSDQLIKEIELSTSWSAAT